MKYLFKISFLLLILINSNSLIIARIINAATVNELQNAVGELVSNDTILIADGIYKLTSTLVINNKPNKINNVTLAGKSGNREAVRIFCPGMGIYSQNAPHVFAVYNVGNLIIQDLTAGDTYYHPITVQGISGADAVYFKNLHLIDAGEQFIKVNNKESPKCNNGIVEGCLLEYTDYPFWDGDSYYTQGIDIIGGGDNWIIRDCTIKNIRPHPGHVNNADGCGAAITFWQGSNNNIIERNVIINCRTGIELGISQGTGVSNSIIRNNFIYRTASEVGGDIGITVKDSPNAKVYNNTVILNGTFNPGSGSMTIEYRFPFSTGLEIKNNLCDGDIWVRTSGLNPDISNNIYAANESWFVNADSFDLHLKSIAINAIDKGVTLPEVTDDFDKYPRPVNNIYDIGADEYGSVNTFVDEIDNDNPWINISPNPASDFIEVSYINPMLQHGVEYSAIRIYNVFGQIVSTPVCSADTHASGGQRIDVSGLAPGMYFVRIGDKISKLIKL